MSELTNRPGIPLTDKEQQEKDAMFQRMKDGTFDDKEREKKK